MVVSLDDAALSSTTPDHAVSLQILTTKVTYYGTNLWGTQECSTRPLTCGNKDSCAQHSL